MNLWPFKHRKRHQTPFVELDTHACQACWGCCAVCPAHVLGKISLPWHKHAVFRTAMDCVGCGKCVAVCAAGALRRLTGET
jgi:NAD-dependent dihydropyrimidine dehydrogenase PreA subunit